MPLRLMASDRKFLSSGTLQQEAATTQEAKAVVPSAVSSEPWRVWTHQSAVLLFRKCGGETGHSACWSIVYLSCMSSYWEWVALCMSLGKAGITVFKSPCCARDSSSKHPNRHLYANLPVITPYRNSLTARICFSLQALCSIHAACVCRPFQQLFVVLWPYHKLEFDVVFIRTWVEQLYMVPIW